MVDFYQFYPCVVPLIGSRYKGETDLMPAAWQVGLSKDPMVYCVSISPKRYTHKLISSSGVFSANFIEFKYLDLVVKFGSVSGKDVDKIKYTGVKLKPAVKLDVPVIEFAYTSYECSVQDIIKAGDHDLFIGKIVYVHEAENIKTETGTINYNKIRPILYLGKDTYITIDPTSVVTMKRNK